MLKNNNTAQIRVLEVFGRMNRGGAESMMMNLYRKMDKTKVQLDFMVHTHEKCQFDEEIKELGGRIFRVPQFKFYNFITYVHAWRCFFKAHPEIRVVHGHIGSTAAIYLYEANRVGCFTIAHSHSAFKMKIHPYHLVYYLLSYPTRFIAKMFLGCSTEAGKMRYGKKIISSTKYHNFPNAIDLDEFRFNSNIRDAVRYDLAIQSFQTVIMHVGRIVPAKNPEMIYSIFKEIIKNDSDAVCIWVGFGELEEKYRNMIINEKLEKRILMLGMRKDISKLLQAADAFLFPSLWEGLPVSVIEAQAAGLPCVISDTIPKEVEVSNLIEWHNLSEPIEYWAKRCLLLAKKDHAKRFSPIEMLRNAGYDINKSITSLTELYIREGLVR